MCLKKGHFDLETAIKYLNNWNKLKFKNNPDFEAKMKELNDKGYENYRLNKIALKKCNGDMKNTIEFIELKAQKHLLIKVKEIEFEGKTVYVDGNLIFNH